MCVKVDHTPDQLLVDTGRYVDFVFYNITWHFVNQPTISSNTWVGAGQSYVRTSTSVETSDTVVRIVLLRFCDLVEKDFKIVSNLWVGILLR
jgi:hypothetical protein